MMLPPIGQKAQQHRGRADSLEQILAERRQSFPALEPKQPGAGIEGRRRGNRGKVEQQQQPTGKEENILIRLPSLKEANNNEESCLLLLQKMRQCQHPVDCWADEEQSEAAEVKADALREVADWFRTLQSATLLDEQPQVQQELLQIVRANLFRVLPPSDASALEAASADPEDAASASGASLDPGWPHLQLVYRLLHQLINRLDSTASKEASNETGLAALFDAPFLGQLLGLFHSEDPREREQLKQAVHALYSRLLPMRAEIRKRMGWLLLAHVYEGQPCRGVAELLEILGDIVNGFNVPLKPEHRDFFLRVLLPLHKPNGYLTYFAQLAYCVALFLEKDATLARHAFQSLLRYWPKGCSAKEILFMAELEELLARVGLPEFRPAVCIPLFRQLARCASSQHCRVAERALQLWNNEQLLALVEPSSHLTLPIMFPALYAASEHWSNNIASLVLKTLKRLMALNAVLFDELLMNHEKEQLRRRKRDSDNEELWKRLNEAIEEKRNNDERREEQNDEERRKSCEREEEEDDGGQSVQQGGCHHHHHQLTEEDDESGWKKAEEEGRRSAAEVGAVHAAVEGKENSHQQKDGNNNSNLFSLFINNRDEKHQQQQHQQQHQQQPRRRKTRERKSAVQGSGGGSNRAKKVHQHQQQQEHSLIHKQMAII